MPIQFDPATRRIVLDAAFVTAREIYSRWCDWVALANNAIYLPAFRAVGGDDLGGGLFIPPYYFLENGWRVRPMETDHTLTIDGNLFVDGGDDPVVQTLGNYNVLVRTVVPVQAQGITTSGSTGPSAESIAAAVLALAQITPIYSDLRRIKGQVVSGSGTEVDPWGPT